MTTEKNFMIDRKYVQLSYKNMEIDDIEYVIYEHNITDYLANMKTDSILLYMLKYGKLKHSVGQWIIRG